MVRVQVIIPASEREEFRRRAAAEGLSLSAWLRAAGLARSRAAGEPPLRSVEDLRAFFASRAEAEAGREPEWTEHLAVIEQSRGGGNPPT